MASRRWLLALAYLVLGVLSPATLAAGPECGSGLAAQISFIQFQSPNIATIPPSLLTIKGKLSLPASARATCSNHKVPAVLILHGSTGVDSRGDFYEEALNAAGIVTLQIDMWEARGVTGLLDRPRLPIFTYPDAFSALAFLSAQPNVDADRIGVLGFSWGGVISLATSEQLYAGLFGAGRKFAAHVANYPVCYGANNAALFAPFGLTPAQAGTQYLHLTGAPVLIQIGSNDDYDNGTAHCVALANSVNPSNNNIVQVAQYPGAYHAWDRIMIPVTVLDPFGNEGSFFVTGMIPTVRIVPDVVQAYVSRDRVVNFFRQNL
jgi:dienelactone hydrolase